MADLIEMSESYEIRNGSYALPYQNLSDLLKYIEAKCNMIDIKFSTKLFDYLKRTYLNELLSKNSNDINIENDAKYINLLFSFIFNKQTFIVGQNKMNKNK